MSHLHECDNTRCHYQHWDVIEGADPPVQVVPTTRAGIDMTHILDDDCWCKPYRDGDRPQLLIHRKEGRA